MKYTRISLIFAIILIIAFGAFFIVQKISIKTQTVFQAEQLSGKIISGSFDTSKLYLNGV